MAEPQVYHTNSEAETKAVGKRLGEMSSPGTVISLRGPLGAGKTVIAKGIAEALGIQEAIVSPTFTLIQEYAGSMRLHHMDLYRIDGVEEFGGIGGEELLYSDGVTLIEWSEKIDEILPKECIKVEIVIESPESRKIRIEGVTL
jgi:tRNA threonylcarbamoyladenosine biosynthesis protein TsaE